MLINTSDNFINNNYRLKKINLRLWEMTDCWKWKISIPSSNTQKLVSALTQHASNLRQNLKSAIFHSNTIFFKCHSLLAPTEIAHPLNCLSTDGILQFETVALTQFSLPNIWNRNSKISTCESYFPDGMSRFNYIYEKKVIEAF